MYFHDVNDLFQVASFYISPVLKIALFSSVIKLSEIELWL